LTATFESERLNHRDGKELMKNITKLLTIAGLAIGFATCASADVVWTLNNVDFNRPGFGTNTATGFFTVNTALDTIVDWNIVVGGTNTQADATYVPTTGLSNLHSLNEAQFFFNPFTNQFLILETALALSNTPGTIDLSAAAVGTDTNPSLACPGCGTLTSGSIVGATVGAVPEPRFGAVLAIGLAGLAFVARRKFAAARS
jgi:hypothetical protein